MTQNIVLVTAIYNHSPYSRLGGRGYDIHFYKAPFLNVIKLGLPIVVFTHENQYEKIQQFFTEVNFDKYELIVYDLENTDITDVILSLKQSHGIIDETGLTPNRSPITNDRNNILCLKKPYYLKYAIDNNLFHGDHYYWIDAGLFHHGLFPETVGGKEKFININETTYWPSNQNSIFRPGLVESLVSKSVQDYIFIKNQTIYSEPLWWSELCGDLQRRGHVVGGFFGGNKQTTLTLYERFNSFMYTLFDHNILPLEEEILSVLYAKYYAEYTLYEFDVWYHDIVTDPCYVGNSKDERCFYKIFL